MGSRGRQLNRNSCPSTYSQGQFGPCYLHKHVVIMSASCFVPSFYPWKWRVGGEQGASDEHAALAAWLRMWEGRGGWIHAQWALAVYQLPRMSHHISIGCWKGTEISHWAEPWYLSEETSQNQPEVKKQAHSAILSSSLVSPYRQMKKLRTRVNDSQDLTASLL